MKRATARAAVKADEIPAFLRIPQSERAKAWEGVTLRHIPLFDLKPKNEDAETAAFRARVEEERKIKARASIERMKRRFVTKAIDYTKMRWDARRNKFVPLEPWATRPVQVAEPAAKPAIRYRVDAGRTAGSNPATGANDLSRVTKDNAEQIARLNGIWKDQYIKLRGTGRIVMTVCNVLRGKVKRGEAITWE